jgi:hypothetical protein
VPEMREFAKDNSTIGLQRLDKILERRQQQCKLRRKLRMHSANVWMPLGQST